jgi:superfamily II DNA or RNA helicase
MLRNYQNNAVDQIEKINGNVMLQMPTGSGKTFTFCELAKRHFAENIQKVLIVVHRQELLQQAFLSLGERCFKIEKGIKVIPHDYDFYVAMVETLNRRIDKLPNFGLVIIDEAHIGNFRKLPFFEINETKVVGVSATPVAEKPLAEYFHNLIMPTNIPYLIENKYLLNCEVYGFASDLVSKQKFKIKGGDFDEKQMEDFYSSEKMVKNVINAYWEKIAGKKTIIFNVNVNHNLAVFEAFKNEGLNVYSITGETPTAERKKAIQDFKESSDGIMCNVGVLTTGYDEPTVQAIVLNRATKSLPLYLQMIGRGSRLSENKEKFFVIDLGKNTTRHGFYDDFFDWETMFYKGSKKEKKGDKESAAPIKECPSCGFLQHTRKIVCENCSHDFEEERQKQQQEEKEQKLFLLIKEKPINIPTDRLYQLAEERLWKPYAVLHKIAEHITNYQDKYKSIVTNEYSNSIAIEELEKWCKKYDKQNNKWHKEFIINLLDEKRRIKNPAGNSNVVQ